ncbi:MAG: hypothetical protein RR426_05480, partial [Oscillospiraceae bacterium]
MKKQDEGRLALWRERYEQERIAYSGERAKMDRREELYRGSADIRGVDGGRSEATHVRNLVQEIIETQVDSNIPQPKVTALRQEDEPLAKLIEDMLRNELDRLPIETMNDEAERVCPIQGGDGVLVDWDATRGTHESIGELALTGLHPKKIIPQDGVYRIADMDWFFLELQQTKGFIRRRYGVDVSDEPEERPEARTVDGARAAEQLVTQIVAYYRGEDGAIGRFSWVNDRVLEDLSDYQKRRLQLCVDCGTVGDGNVCRACGGHKFREELREYEELTEDVFRSDGTIIPASVTAGDGGGWDDPLLTAGDGGLLPQLEPGGFSSPVFLSQQETPTATRIPYYEPKLYPLVLRKNVTRFGSFLGGSDVDAVEMQQNAMNKLSTKINKKVLGGGSFTTKPAGLNFEFSDEDGLILNVDDVRQLQMIHTYNTQVDISTDLALRREIYEEARQQIGITDSMQGRRDTTATSAVAKEFSASQAAGRLESKKVMKQAAYADLFRLMFRTKLAYADEPRPVVAYNERGEKEYKEWNRWDFLKQDAAGDWYWNDGFLFSCDSAAPLAADRQQMWRENRMNLQEGAYGSPQDPEALVLFWEIMER